MSKTVLEILMADLAKNYPEEPQDVGAYHAKLMNSIEQGLVKLYREFDTLFIVHGNEWHTLHGGSTADIIAATLKFLETLRGEGLTRIFTCYDNPKISGLVGHIPYPTHVDQVNEGKYRTFKLSVEM